MEDFVRAAKDKYGEAHVFHDNFYLRFLANHLQTCTVAQIEDLMKSLASLRMCGVQVLSQCFFPALFDSSQVNMTKITKSTGESLQGLLDSSLVYAGAMQYALGNSSDPDAFKEAAIHSTYRKGTR